MTAADTAAPLLGWVAASLTLVTFACQDGQRLRIAALSANAAFVAYGLTAGLMPILALHLVLIPINLWRLACARRAPPAWASTTSPDASVPSRRPGPARYACDEGKPCCKRSPASQLRSPVATRRATRAMGALIVHHGTGGAKAHGGNR